MTTEVVLGAYGTFEMGATVVPRYKAVTLSSGVLAAADGSVGPILGICMLDDALEGQATKVQVSGIAKCESAATISAGAIVTTNAAGELEEISGDHYPLGVLLEDAADGRIVKVDLQRSLVVEPAPVIP